MCIWCNPSIISGVLVTLGVVLIGLGSGLGWGLFPALVRDAISAQKALVEGTETWDLWVEIPIPMRFEIYLFEVTNPLEVLAGVKPSLQQRGPYVYDEWRKKQNIEVSTDGTEVTYSQVTTFYFNQELSGDLKESDTVTVINAALLGAILTADKDDNPNKLQIINGAIPNVFPGDNPLFSTSTVKKVLFDGQLVHCAGATPFKPNWYAFCTGLNVARPENIRPEYDENGVETGNFLYSYLSHKNGSTTGVFTINTGAKDASKLGQIQKWGEDAETQSDALTNWSGPECNKISGTDGMFPPFLNSKSVLEIFGADICKSVKAVYQEDIVYQGVPGLKFIVDELQLGSMQDTPDNYCYCAENSACLKKGTLDLFACVGAPVILTFPHFFQASEDYLKLVTGLAPEKEKHQLYFDIEPNTGVPLSGRRRVQLNMMLKKVRGIDAIGDAPSALIPLLWIDGGLDLDTPHVQRLKDTMLRALSVMDGVRWGIISLAIAIILGGVVLFCFS